MSLAVERSPLVDAHGRPVRLDARDTGYYRPEDDRVWTLRQVMALVRLVSGELTAQYVASVQKEIEKGWLTRWADLCSRMGRDPVVRRAFDMRRSAVASRAVEVEVRKGAAGSEQLSGRAMEYARVVADRVQDLELVAMRALDAIGTGIAIHEIMWERSAGTWWPARFVPVLTREVRLDGDWTPLVRDAQYVFHRTADHPGKFWVHQPHTQAGTFADQGVFTAAVWPWLFKVFATKFWMISSERYGSPFAIGKIGAVDPATGVSKTSEEAKAALLEDMKRLAVDSVGVFNSGADIDIKPPAAQASGALFGDLVDHFNQEITLAILGSPDLLRAGQVGAYAAVKVRDGLRLETTHSDASLLWSSFSRDVLTWGLRYNGLGAAPVPRLKTVFAADVQPFGPADVPAGAATIDDWRTARGLDKYGPENGGDEKIVPAAPGGAPAASPFAPPPDAPPRPPSPSRGGMPDLSRVRAPYR